MNSRTDASRNISVPYPRSRAIAVWTVITLLTSSAAVLIRFCGAPASSVGFWRVMGAAIVLGPAWRAAWRAAGQPALFARGTVVTGIFLGLHFASWTWAVQHTTLANAALFIALQPLMAPFVARPLIGERLNRWELVACGLAAVGMFVILGRQFALERQHLPGTLMALGSALLCATYFVLSRKHRAREHAILFTVPVYLAAAATQAIAAVALDGGIFVGDERSALAIFGLVLLPTVGGHTLAIWLLRHVKSQMVVLSVPMQFVLVTLWGVALFREVPSRTFFLGAAFVLAGVALGVLKSETPAAAPTPSPR